MTQTTDTDLIKAIEGTPAGKSFSLRTESRYAQVARRDGQLVVETGWTVLEQMDSDWESSLYWPFRGTTRSPWRGWQLVATDVQHAAEVYATWRQELRSHLVASKLDGATAIGTEARR